MKTMYEKTKRFIGEHKKEIYFVGGVIVGVTVARYICKNKGVEIEYKLPEWAEQWKQHCNKHLLLYENGLPIYANIEHTKIYRDAIVEEAIPEFIELGYEIIERA